MLQLLLYALPSQRVQKTNLLPTGMVIASNNNHRRLLPTECFGPPTQSILGYRTEPSFLSNQCSSCERGALPFGVRRLDAALLATRAGSRRLLFPSRNRLTYDSSLNSHP